MTAGPTKERIFEMLAAIYNSEQMQPNDVLASDLSKQLGITKSRAYKFLDRLVKEGKFVKVKTRTHGGLPCCAYRPVADGNKMTLPKRKDRP